MQLRKARLVAATLMSLLVKQGMINNPSWRWSLRPALLKPVILLFIVTASLLPVIDPCAAQDEVLFPSQDEGHDAHYRYISPGDRSLDVIDLKSNQHVAKLHGDEEVDSFSPSSPISSTDGKLVAYSVGGASYGTKIRCFRLTTQGPQQIKLNISVPQGEDIWHVYLTPIKFVKGGLIYNLGYDGSHNNQHFSHEVRRLYTF